MKIKFIISLILIKLCTNVCAQFNLKLNDDCNSDVTGSGNCVLPANCSVFQYKRNELKICSFQGTVPIVCCPKNIRTSKRISKEKCEEYSSKTPIRESSSRVARQINRQAAIQLEDTHYFPTVVGGIKVTGNEFPHMSAIGWREMSNIIWRCGGSLISENFVLSAAHCTIFRGVQPSVIRIGDKDLKRTDDNAIPQDFDIEQIFVYPSYSRSLKYHDIALFRLNENAILNSHVFPACLYQNQDEPPLVEAMGWGETSYAGANSDVLMKVLLRTTSNSHCNESYIENDDLPNGISPAHICAYDPERKKDTCLGDSGGPLQISTLVRSFNKIYEVVGITSFGFYCASGIPAVYVRVYSYLDWIENIVWPSNKG